MSDNRDWDRNPPRPEEIPPPPPQPTLQDGWQWAERVYRRGVNDADIVAQLDKMNLEGPTMLRLLQSSVPREQVTRWFAFVAALNDVDRYLLGAVASPDMPAKMIRNFDAWRVTRGIATKGRSAVETRLPRLVREALAIWGECPPEHESSIDLQNRLVKRLWSYRKVFVPSEYRSAEIPVDMPVADIPGVIEGLSADHRTLLRAILVAESLREVISACGSEAKVARDVQNLGAAFGYRTGTADVVRKNLKCALREYQHLV